MAENTNQERKSFEGNEEERLEEFKKNLSIDGDAVYEQIIKADEDNRFINIPGGMWEGFLERIFGNRTRLQFDTVSDYLMRFLGEWEQNRVGVEYKPDDDVASDKDAEILNGIFRADFRDGSGRLSVDNAVQETVTTGYGAFKIAPVYEDEEDPESEAQRIEWRPITDAHKSVIWDSSAKRVDKRDARWVTELTEYTKEAFEEEFPGKSAISAYTPQDRGFWRWFWFKRNDPVYVATRYEVVRKKSWVYLYNNLESGKIEYFHEEEHEDIKDELAKNENMNFARRRRILRQYVEKTVFSGADTLKKTRRIAGKWLPIIPMYGFRAFVDGAEWSRGMVRKLKDPARVFNMQISQLAENSASAGQDVPIFDPDQMPPQIAELWADRTNKPYLLAKALKDEDGNLVHQGPLGYLKPPRLDDSSSALMQLVPQFIRDMVGGVPQDTIDPNASGKAINAMIKRANLNTQPLLTNIKRSIEWSGTVYQAMASEVYDREQMVRTLDIEGKEDRVRLTQTIYDEKTGKFIQANSLRGKKFRVYSDVGPQFETIREEQVENLKSMGEMIKDTNQADIYLPVIISVMIDKSAGSGLSALKDFNRKQMLLRNIVKPATDEEKELVAQANQPKSDPQADLIKAAANQANAEAEEAHARARNLDSDSIDNMAAARKKAAETFKIMSEAQDGRVRTLADIRRQTFEEAKSLPLPN